MGISTHILDQGLGRPAAGVAVLLELDDGVEWTTLGRAVTDADGRIKALLTDPSQCSAGVYRVTFDLDAYFAAQGKVAFYPQATVQFRVVDAAAHYHVPLLLNQFGYSTYRGS
ncbi:MAG: hydroxyisourate hydrolase [Deltaproteobacteria bacterium]|nr:hydroxyisourate hydrolase [Deltaproteobacteria bacterium]